MVGAGAGGLGAEVAPAVGVSGATGGDAIGAVVAEVMGRGALVIGLAAGIGTVGGGVGAA
jgi:hypothetical protein